MSTLGENNAGSWVGVALSRTEIVAYDSRLKSAGGPAWRMPLEAPAADQPSWVSLTTALRTLAQLTKETRGHLAIALLPSIAEVRRVDVPPLSDDELEAVLSRNAAKYFVGAQGAQLVGVTTSEGARGEGVGVVAAAMPAWLARLISAAARDGGWTLEHMVPAEAAWVAAVSSVWPAAAREDAQLLVHHYDRTDALHLTKNALVNVRRFRDTTADAPVLMEAVSKSARLMAFGDAGVRKEWITALGARALTVSLPTNIPLDVANDPALLAAAFVADVKSFVFRTEEMRAADRRRRSRAMYTVLAAAAVLVVASTGFLLWDVQRELASVQAARAALKPELTTTLLGRTTVETVSGQLEMLAATERESAHWSKVIADVTKQLPDEAHLTSFRGWSDSARFDGLAEHAASVFPSLSRAESFSGIKAGAPVRLEAQVDGSSLERFVLVAKLRKPPAAPRVAEDSTKPARSAAKGAQ